VPFWKALSQQAIGVHRYVLLDEMTQHYALNLADQRFQRFFGLAIAIRTLCASIAIWFILGHFVFGAPMLFVCFAAALATG
jgi:hypothetical protein